MADTKHYRSPFVFYRLGVTYQPGALISVPADFKPGKGWEEVSDAPAEKAPAKAPAPEKEQGKGKGRASDASPL